MKLFLTVLAVAALAAADDNALQKTLNDGNDQFTAKVFSEVVKAHPDKSVVLSAFSVMPPLAQLGLASVGESQDELLNAIGLKNENTTKDVFRMVNSRLRSVKGITLDMANRVYVRNNRELNDNFAKLSSEIFNSDVKNVDFKKNVETAKEINTWVEDQTNHRIKDLVDPSTLDDSTEAVLVNALYFKGKWKTQFRPEETKDRDFRVNKQTTIKVPTMHKQATYLYGESKELNAKLLEMYYEGEEASFLVVLPNEVDGLSALEEKLKDPAALKKATEAMYTTEVDVYLPKFKIETTTDLKEVLQKVGITKLFTSGKARLDNLLKGSSNLYVSNAIQKAFIEVNEEGAEAAAANVIKFLMKMPLPPSPPPPVFKADKPFYYEIRYNFDVDTKPSTFFNPLSYWMTHHPNTLTLFSGVLREVKK